MSATSKSDFGNLFEGFVNAALETKDIGNKLSENAKKCCLNGPKLPLDVLQEKHEKLDKRTKDLEEKIAAKKKNELLLKEDIKILRDTCASKKAYENKLKKSILTVQNEISAMESDCLAKNDQEKLNKCKKKLALYELCTGVIFDYSHKDVVKGFVQNPKNNYLNTFSIEKNMDVETSLWQESVKAGNFHCSLHPNSLEHQEELS